MWPQDHQISLFVTSQTPNPFHIISLPQKLSSVDLSCRKQKWWEYIQLTLVTELWQVNDTLRLHACFSLHLIHFWHFAEQKTPFFSSLPPPPPFFSPFFLNMVFLPHRAARFEDFEDCCQQVIKICHLQLAQHYIPVQKHFHPSEVNALPYIYPVKHLRLITMHV